MALAVGKVNLGAEFTTDVPVINMGGKEFRFSTLESKVEFLLYEKLSKIVRDSEDNTKLSLGIDSGSNSDTITGNENKALSRDTTEEINLGN